MNKNNATNNRDEFIKITFGTLLVTLGIYFFKFPNHFCTGGVSGISVILTAVFPKLSAGSYISLINLFMLLVGYLFIGKDFGFKTAYSSLLLSGATFLLERSTPISKPLTTQPLLELIFAILLTSIGSAYLFQCNASTGGTDIVAMIVKKFTSWNIAKALFAADFIIVLLTFFVFNSEVWLFSMLGFMTKIFILNRVIHALYLSKYCTIIVEPQYSKQVCDYITAQIHKSATVSEAYMGAYAHNKKAVILVALSPSQASSLEHYVNSLDSHSFMIATETAEITGNGFRSII